MNRGQVSNYLIPWDKYDFGPRIGIAYQIGNKTVIRAGYGIFYGGEENQGGMLNRGYNVPGNETVTMARTNGISTFVGISDPTVQRMRLHAGRTYGRVSVQSVHFEC